MFALSKGLIAQITERPEFYVSILGLDNAGKTTFLERVKSIFNDAVMTNPARITPTVGMNSKPLLATVESKDHFFAVGKIDHKRIKLIFWDVGGQAELQTLWDKYISECHAIIYVIDASDEERIDESQESFRKVVAYDRVKQLPFLILFNKCDKKKPDEECTSLQKFKQELADTRNNDTSGELAIMSISAYDNLNIERCIKWLGEAIHRQYSSQA